MMVKRRLCKQSRKNCLILGIVLVIVIKVKFGHLMLHNQQAVTFLVTDGDNRINALRRTLDSLVNLTKDIEIVLLLKNVPYPPLSLPVSPLLRVHVENDISLEIEYSQHLLHSSLNTEYIVIIPAGVILDKTIDSQNLDVLCASLYNEVKMVSVPVLGYQSQCLGTKFKQKEWTVQYFALANEYLCDAVSGPHVIFMRQKDFLELPKPLLRPMHQSLYLQAVVRGWKTKLISSKEIVLSHMTEVDESKFKLQEESTLKDMYNDLGIKLVQGPHGEEDWYGCSKETARCFPTVISDMPSYLYLNRWTPPCCLSHLRTTARYVFKLLQKQGIRYWLEGGSLLGAARNGDIIPWDYDIDIGIYQDDLLKSEHLVQAQTYPVLDEMGFVWEKAREGNFFRVQYSANNHLHVDIFPFYSRNGIMTKDTWFHTHKQDCEFPEYFLKPLTTITFIGMQVSAPNNWTDFLELKFGKGVVHSPKYPNLQSVVLT